MDRAYDSILQTIVSAADADPEDQFRYTCLCCKERVFVASPQQRVQVVHFRHHQGNNGTADCENYMPQPGQSLGGSKPQSDSITFYYDNAKKAFVISLILTEEDIQQCEQENVCLELRTSYASTPFYSCPINSLYFSARSPMPVLISQYSENYYCSFSVDGKRRRYQLFKKEQPAFFKVLGDANTDFIAKQILSNCLYTETTYFAVFVDYHVPETFPASVNVMECINFQTCGRKFVGILLQFEGKDADIDYYLSQMGYHLETAESLSVIWPPIPKIDDVYQSDSKSIFVLSSFSLKAKRNTNAEDHEIVPMGNGVFCISHSGELRIHYKNADATVKAALTRMAELQPLLVEEDSAVRFVVPDGDGIYVLHQNGTHSLRSGQEITLLPDGFVAFYWHTYILKRIYCQRGASLDGRDLLDDALRNYKVHVSYSAAQFTGVELSQVAKEYLLSCEETGVINRAVAELIERGVI